jgi:hypothetical protein
MKLLAGLFGLLLSLSASAGIIGSGELQWGVAATIDFTMFNTDGTVDVDEADGGTEVTLYCDEAAGVTATNDFADEGTFYSLVLTAAELRCARLVVSVAPTGPIEVFGISTTGSHSAANPRGVIRAGTAQGGAAQSITLDASASATTDAYVGHPVRIIAGTGSGQGDRTGTAYNGTSKVLTVNAAWLTTPDNTSVFQIDSDKEPIITADANGVVSANVVQQDGDAGAAATAEAFFDGTSTALANVTIGTVTTLTGHTAQTGDVYPLIGAPVSMGSGATLAANLVDIEGQTDNLPSDPADDSEIDLQLDAINDFIDSEVAAIYTATLPASIRTAVGLASANLDTQFTGVEGGITYNSAWDAEIQSEAADALAAIYLDQLLANTYNPASPPGATDSLLEDLIENDGGATQFNANALEDAPTGEGESLAAIAEAVWEAFIEGSVTARCAMAVDMAEAAGNYTDSGQVRTFFARDGVTNRIIGTMATDGTTRSATSISCTDL